MPETPTRVNDRFLYDHSIDATPIDHDITHPLIQGQPRNVKTLYQADFYKNIACDIVTESVFNYPYPFITEKTTRPIACKRMFIIVGPANTLSLLRSKGFQTFGDIINEHYDTIDDPVARFQCLIDSIRSFFRLDIKVIRAFYKNNQDRFEHNFKTLINLRQKEYHELRQKLFADADGE